MTVKLPFFSFLLLLIWLSSGVMPLQKRSDDTDMHALMTLVQQQAATIQSMQARLTSLESSAQQQANTITDLSTKLSAVNGSLVSDLKDVSTRINTQVFFTAHMSKSPVTMGTDAPLKFDAVVNNAGGGYNPATGVFIAPVSGVYVLYAQLMKHGNVPVIHYVIDKSGTLLCMNAMDSGNDYDKSSCLATVHLQKGEQVFVRRYNGDFTLHGLWYCAFSGFLLSMDG